MVKTQMLWRIAIILFASAVLNSAFAQSPFRRILCHFKDSTHILDSNYILPGTVRWSGNDTASLVVAIHQKSIEIHSTSMDSITLAINYQVLSASPDIIVMATDSVSYRAIHEAIPMSYKFRPPNKPAGKIASNELDYAGAFGRGLTFGNNQNLVLNSTLDLQLSGKLGDDIEINAAITDQNLPIQADGNTARLNELDKVFIELKRKNQSLLAGDQQLQPDHTYFLNYYKKYKGLQFNTLDTLGNGASLKTSLGGAIARGNFRRQTLDINEGNQGPYRLTGNGNDLFIIVLSASEKVYLDGTLLFRGLENDYVMDYNKSEISFTAKHLVNRNSRIVVEFEYSNQSYLKSAWSLQSKYQYKNLSVQWNSYLEGDNKTSNILQSLNAQDKSILQEAGDQTSQLKKSTITPIDPSVETNGIRYRLIDTLVNGTKYFNILKINQSAGNQDYSAQFNYVGAHAGNYVIENNLFTNGRAYRWVAPDPSTLIPQGEYEPQTALVAPKKQSQHSVKIEFKPNSGFYTSSEISLSNLDLNLYSTKDKGDNMGVAWKQTTGYHKKLNAATWKNEISIENQSKTFSIFEPFRNPEFERNWSLGTANQKFNGDLLTVFSSELIHPEYELGYQLQQYNRNGIYHGSYHGWNARWNKYGTAFRFYGSALTNNSVDYSGSFSRPHLELSQNLSHTGHQIIGIFIENESNKQVSKSIQTLLPLSFSFQTVKAFYKGVLASAHMDYNIEFSRRVDKTIAADHFDKHFSAEDLTIEHNWQISKNSNWSFRLGDRKLIIDHIVNPLTDKNSHTLLLRQSFNTKSNSGAFRYYETIESNSGQEPATEYTYIKVNKGQGYYTWIDANKDSIIQVTEFEPAPFSDQGEYIRYAITGTDFVKTRNYLFLENIEIDGARLGNPENHKWYQKLSFISTINTSWKVSDNSNTVLPFNLQNTGIISAQSQVRNQLYLYRGNPKYELQAGNSTSATKWRLSTGFETKSINEIFVRSRQKISNVLSLENYIARVIQKNMAETFQGKNYSIANLILEPKISYQSNNSFRLSLSYRLRSGKEKVLGTRSLTNEGKVEFTYLPISQWSFRSSFSSIWASLQGKQSPLTEYSMLQGLRSGYNALFQINVDRQINANTILRFGYNGRKSEGSKYIQTGQAQVVASF